MTKLTRPVRRRVSLPRGEVTVTLHPDGRISFRHPWQRDEWTTTLAKVYLMAADAYQQQQAAERKAARKARRNSV